MKALEHVKRFDMLKEPKRQNFFLRILAWILSFPDVWKHRAKINKINMEGLKPPYIMLNTHMAFLDFKVATAAIFPHRSNNIVAIDGFIGREGLLRNVGCICKRKFTNDAVLIRHLYKVIKKNKDILIIYPEARYSLIGTNAVLPESLGKLVKLLKVPVVVLRMHGHYLNSPFWNLKDRNIPVEADMTQIITQEDVNALSHTAINARINEAFQYDEYQWQRDNNVKITYEDNAKGLHKVLYQCPNCLTEYRMRSGGRKIWCEHCHKAWEMDDLGQLHAVEGDTEFSHIPDWYEFERAQVRAQIEAGTYHFSDDVIVDALPNAKGFIRIGNAKLTHSMDGFTLEGVSEGEPYSLHKEPLSMYSVHIEYEYFGKGDCVDINTLDDTFYIYPQGECFSVTKMSLATEELYKYYVAKAEEDKAKVS